MQAGTASADTALARGFDAAGHQTIPADVTSSRFVDNLPVQSRRLEPGIRCALNQQNARGKPIGRSRYPQLSAIAGLLLRALNMPKVKGVIPVRRILHVLRFERFPVAHIEVVRHNPGTRLHLLPDVWPDH